MAPNSTNMLRRPGVFERTVTRLLMRPASVSAVDELSAKFRIIEFQGQTLRACSWTPGDKLQIKLDGGLITRTYTPIAWDRERGATRIIAYCHGDGPGSEWIRCTRTDDERQLFGPRASLDLEDLPSVAVFFGDETSIGLAVAAHRTAGPGSTRHFIFEVNDKEEAATILGGLDVPAVLVEREPGDRHLEALLEAILGLAEPDATFVLTGKSASIQRVSRALKAMDISTRRLRTKAYWAPGKKGLD